MDGGMKGATKTTVDVEIQKQRFYWHRRRHENH